MHVLRVFSPRRTRQFYNERNASVEQTVQCVNNCIVVGKGMQASAARPYLARRLRTTQQQQTQDSELRWIKLVITVSDIAELLRVLLHAIFEILFNMHEMLVAQITGSMLHLTHIQ